MILAQISTDVTAASCALSTVSCDLATIKSMATTVKGGLEPSLADRIATLEVTVATLAGQISSINKRVIDLLYPPEGA